MERAEKEIVLLTMSDIEKITGWSINTIKKLMKQEDFPAIKIGKENQVFLEAFKQYLMRRRDLRGE